MRLTIRDFNSGEEYESVQVIEVLPIFRNNTMEVVFSKNDISIDEATKCFRDLVNDVWDVPNCDVYQLNISVPENSKINIVR